MATKRKGTSDKPPPTESDLLSGKVTDQNLDEAARGGGLPAPDPTTELCTLKCPTVRVGCLVTQDCDTEDCVSTPASSCRGGGGGGTGGSNF